MKSSTKKIIKFALILTLILFAHDLLFSELSSEKLFFPKLFEKNCFHQIFEKDITDEQIIYFNCFSELWTSGWHYEIAFLCDEQCFSSLFNFEYQGLAASKIGEIKDKTVASYRFYTIIKKQQHYREKQVNNVIIYYYFYDEGYRGEELWYEPDSQLCLFVTYKL